MKTRWTLALATIGVLLSEYLPVVYSQGLMGGLKGHNRGSGAVELLLATGILAKLLNFRNKHGAKIVFRMHCLGPHIMETPRYPLELQQVAGHPLLQDDLLEHHASMSSLALSDADLMLNQESALLASKAPLLMSPSMLTDSSALLAEAQLGQQLLAARKARKILEAKKFLAAQEASSYWQPKAKRLTTWLHTIHFIPMLYLQISRNRYFNYFCLNLYRNVYTSLPAPKSLPQRRPNSAPQQIAFPSGSGHASAGFIGSNMPPQYQGMQGQQNSGSQTIFPSHQNNFHGNSGLQGNSAPQNNYQSNSIPQGGYQSNSVPQGGFQGSSGPQGIHNNQGPSDSVMAGSESSPHYHSMPYRPHYGHQGHYRGNSGQGMNSYMSPDEARHFQAAVSRADDVLTIPSDFDDEDAAQIIASLHS
ncbi:uncharacterized protein TNIN_346371 [Trichonephila inaurata madagascariensis]|uniref:Uncharacterized protein n=1 Tax=Trichonephila inaurata madagascariensis TaxID=2747483 RepID=A0A8X6Y9A6_9ARAC|nr:uncharacterized protein TNIN_346371 [Trichonephila inaurata madagascariensis]